MENNIQNELDALKSQVRTLQRALALFAGFTLAAIVALTIAEITFAVVTPDEIKAGKFTVVNEAGMDVAAMAAGPDGGLLGVSTKEGQPVAALASGPYGGTLAVYNNYRRSAAVIGVDPQGGGIRTMNRDGEVTARLP